MQWECARSDKAIKSGSDCDSISAEYRARLAEMLKDPEFRKIDGFPIGTDEAILVLSDPPYYTACLNPLTLCAHGIGAHNRRRDELVFAMADTVLVGEITAGGQMVRRVRETLDRGKQVRLVGPESACDEGLLLAGAIRSGRGEQSFAAIKAIVSKGKGH